jgi:HdeA/HdeB family
MGESISGARKSVLPTRHRNVAKFIIAGMASLFALTTSSFAQVELKTYADAKGYINVKTLSCAQLAGTFQEDADFLGVWYSGWFNGHNKSHVMNIARTKDGIHDTIVYCKANPDKKVIEAVQAVVKGK